MRESDSRNEVFLSALDLFTLLLFVFIGVVWREVGFTSGRDALYMPMRDRVPVVNKDTHTVVLVAQDHVKLRWSEDSIHRGDGSRCKLLLERPNRGPSVFDQVPCWPAAFSAEKLSLDARLKDEASGQMALAVCAPGEVGLEACARLVLVARDHGVEAAILVAKP
jgi:hypothetical protein